MVVTHGHKHDFSCLKRALKTEAGYIGVIASRTKRTKFIKDLKALNFDQKNINRISMPAGIDIGAQTPEEIALSISAEIVKFINKNSLDADKFKGKNLLKK